KKHLSPKQRRETVLHFIERVGLADRMGNKPQELSGGQRQRVAIARALVTAPLIVLADEPTANLDTDTGHTILSLMEEINRNDHTTFIFSTHDHHIMEHAHRVITLRDGTVVGT
ncbi:MAG TPA: ATP-binding cassette domain-containing protein, partial [Spirochaetia bacterium]|nr:ATP-binding cassette domain-containing protein [Spirochaetia bacterium]